MARAFALAGLLISIASTGCAPAISCHRGDRRCAEVRRHLERTRYAANGGRCWTPVIMSRVALEKMGPSIAPYLVQALNDPEPAVAEQAAMVLDYIGQVDDLRRWCAADPQTRLLSSLRCR